MSNKNLHPKVAFVVALFSLSFSLLLSACPCGCGSPSPLALGAGDEWKIRLGIEQKYWQGLVDEAHKAVFYDSPKETSILSFGAARAISSNWSVSGLVPIEQNVHPDGGYHHALSDPTLTLRKVEWDQVEGQWYPELHLHSSIKAPVGRSIAESEKDHLMDVHGNGFWEWMNGFDAWYSSSRWRVGVSGLYVVRRPSETVRRQEATRREYGATIKAKSSLAYLLHGVGELGVALERESKSRDKARGVDVEDSDVLAYRVQLQGQLRLDDRQTLGFSYSNLVDVMTAKNARRSYSVTMSVSQAI